MDNLRHLKPKTEYSYTYPKSDTLDTFLNPGVDLVTLECYEFTSLCPITGQPDYSDINITYIPDKLCVESKSLKLYLGCYRQFGGFTEAISKKILTDLKKVLDPVEISVTVQSASRGGIAITSTCKEVK